MQSVSPSQPDPSPSVRELTVRAVVLGVALSALLTGANAYLGLKVGMTVSASIPAAVLSMALLRLFRRSSILENNLVQTAASAGESLAAGAIFTLPALVLCGFWQDFAYVDVLLVTVLGGVLGVLFSIPLRRALIVETPLAFPEGVATTTVLKAGDRGGHGIRVLAVAGTIGFVVKVMQSGLKLLAGSVTGAFTAGRAVFGWGCDLSAALVAVGYIVTLRIAMLVFLGGAFAWAIAIPVYALFHGAPVEDGVTLEGYAAAITIWSTKVRYIGVGAMFVGGIRSLVALAGPVTRGIRSSLESHRRLRSRTVEVDNRERDLSPRIVLGALLGCGVLLAIAFHHVLAKPSLGLAGSRLALLVLIALVLAIVAGFLFSAVAGYMAGLVGSSNNPVSGVTIATVLVTALLFATIAPAAGAGIAATILVASAVCCAAAISGDNLQDLKAGHIVGATPVRQQVMQIVGVLAGAIVIAPVLNLLYQAYGISGHLPRPGMDPAEALAAPQATLIHAVARGVFEHRLEWGMIAIGCGVAGVIIAVDEWQRRRRGWRVPVLAVAVGIYLPVELSVPILVGGLLAHATRNRGESGLLASSGLIAGEALCGIALAVPFAAARTTDVIAVAPQGFAPFATALGIAAFLGVCAWLYRAGK